MLYLYCNLQVMVKPFINKVLYRKFFGKLAIYIAYLSLFSCSLNVVNHESPCSPGAPANPLTGLLDESSEPLRTVTLRTYPGGPASPVSTTGRVGTSGRVCWPGCWGLDGCLGGLIWILCLLGCTGWLGLYGCGGMMRGMWICWIVDRGGVESGKDTGLSGLKVIPKKARRKRQTVARLSIHQFKIHSQTIWQALPLGMKSFWSLQLL